MRPPSWPKHGYPISIDAQQDPRATGPLATASGTAGGILDHGSAEGGLSCFLGLFGVHGFSTFLYQVGNRTHTPPDASIAQLGWAGGSAVFYEDCHSLPALRWF
jgi:hypothetical protein